MHLVLTDLNWIAITIATAVVFFMGGLWFTVLFPKAYAQALGIKTQPPNKPIYMIGPLICSFITVLTSAILIHSFKIETVRESLSFGCVIGLGYLTSTCVNTAINPNMPNPLQYGLVSGSFFFLSGIVMNVILVSLN